MSEILRGGLPNLLDLRFQMNPVRLLHTRLRKRLRALEECAPGEPTGRALEIEALAAAADLRRRLDRIQTLLTRYEELRSSIAARNLRRVVSVAGRYRRVRSSLTFLDLVQEGNAGLLHSLDRFEASRGYRFSTYATWWIRQSISRALREQGGVIRVPVHQVDALRRYQRGKEEFIQKHAREPDLVEAAGLMGVEPELAGRILAATRRPVSLGIGPEGEEQDLGTDGLAAGVENTVDVLDRIAMREEIDLALSKIAPRDREVLRLRYGLGGRRPCSFEEIGRRLRVTRERVRQIELRALGRLRHLATRGFLSKTRALFPEN